MLKVGSFPLIDCEPLFFVVDIVDHCWNVTVVEEVSCGKFWPYIHRRTTYTSQSAAAQ